jgi:hypothetical protein
MRKMSQRTETVLDMLSPNPAWREPNEADGLRRLAAPD